MADNLTERKSSIAFIGNNSNGEYLYIIQTDKSKGTEIHGYVTITDRRFANKEIQIDLSKYRGFAKEVESVLEYLEDNNIINKE